MEAHERTNRLRRLAEELDEEGFGFLTGDTQTLLLTELDYALRPPVHERRAPTYGSIVEPAHDPEAWSEPTELTLTRRAVGELAIGDARRFADGLSSWLVRADDTESELIVFDRAAGSERDLVVLADATGATLIQRHPTGAVRAVGAFGVLRWNGIRWYHEPPVAAWVNTLNACGDDRHHKILGRMLEFAVHDLGARGIGAILVFRPREDPNATYELRLQQPPPLQIKKASDLAPLRHVLAQIDGAAVFDESGILRDLGVRLVPSVDAISLVEGYRGMRHTAGRRYSHDDPDATVIVVSEDGPVTVLRRGHIIGRSELERDDTPSFADETLALEEPDFA